MINKTILKIIAVLLIFSFTATAQISINIDPTKGHQKISDALYGRNNNLSDDPSKPASAAQIQLIKDAGVKFIRESGGNNSTKHNWRLKISSHPDWFNNVYKHDWDYEAKVMQDSLPGVQGMWSFQLLGKVASNNKNNWGDYAFNQQYGFYPDRNFNLAGGGSVDNTGKLLTSGDGTKYTMDWPADSTVAILNHWFTSLKYDKSVIQYWNMDNEADVWDGKHDDVLKADMPVEEYITKYVAVATKARAIFPEIKLVGPVFTNEWQWYNWQTGTLIDPKDKKTYVWSEYFIKRMAEEQVKTGVRLLDVLDYHFYPGTTSDRNTTLQIHRIFYDTTWIYPKANGIKKLGPNGWNAEMNKEFIWERCNRWLDKYMGNGHGVTLGMSECGDIYNSDPNVVACWYASHLGEFAKNNVELFSPWTWYKGQWEVMHLFTHYTGQTHVESVSSLDTLVSGYSSINTAGDTLSVVIVNRDVNVSKTVTLNLTNTNTTAVSAEVHQLSGLPTTETFKSRTDNALKHSTTAITNNSLSLAVPKLSVTAVQIPLTTPVAINNQHKQQQEVGFTIYPNPVTNQLIIKNEKLKMNNSEGYTISIHNTLGQEFYNSSFFIYNSSLTIDVSQLESGIYFIRIGNQMQKFIKQ